jgi:glycosidase
MKDFIFGTLATDELRSEHVRTRRAGVSHYQRRTPRDPLPGQEIKVDLSVGPNHPAEQAWVYWTNDGTDPIGKWGGASNGFATPMERVGVEWDTALWGYIEHFRGVIPGLPAGSILRYYLSACSSIGDEVTADHGTIYSCYIDDDPTPAWSQDAIVYQIFVDRFFPGNGKAWLSPATPAGFYGGTLIGIIEKLDYLRELGVNVLWLTPVFPSPSHHGYDVTDLFDVEPRLGSKADLRNLLDEAHRRSIRILLDLVPNHVSNLHPSFQYAITNENSPYAKWYTFSHWPDKYQSFFNVPELPQLNLREPAARQHMLDAAAYWLNFGVDGYRVDYAVGPAPDFWADFRRVTWKSRPDCWTFGEVVEPPDSQLTFEGGLDGCLDFNLMEGEWRADQLASFLVRHEAYFPESFSRPSFLDNHDMNRFLWAAEGDFRRLCLAALCQFTLSGAPVIYYGTEVGLSQLRDVRQNGRGLPEESRLPMLWGSAQNVELLKYYHQLIEIRRNYTALGQGKVRVLHADKDVLLYKKETSERLLVALNLSQETQKVKIQTGSKEILVEAGENTAQCRNSDLTLSPLAGAIILFH